MFVDTANGDGGGFTVSLAQSILNSMHARIAVVNADGEIVLTNAAWQQFAQSSGDPDERTTGMGVNYLEATRRSAEDGDTSAAKAYKGIRAVLSGARDAYELRYPCHSPTEEHWFLMRVTPLKGSSPRGAVIAHIEITTQHLQAREQRRRAVRQERTRQHTRELAAVQAVVARTLPSAPPSSDDLEARYMALLEQAVEQRIFRVEHDLHAGAQALAQTLGRQTAGPRDVIALHKHALDTISSRERVPRKVQIYLEEARLQLIEVMGYLVSYYRAMIIDHLEQEGL